MVHGEVSTELHEADYAGIEGGSTPGMRESLSELLGSHTSDP